MDTKEMLVVEVVQKIPGQGAIVHHLPMTAVSHSHVCWS
jgi:hypothetical protein